MGHFAFNQIKTFTPSTTATIMQILAATNHDVKVNRITITGKGNAPTDVPIQFDLVRQTSAGSGGSSLTGSKSHTGGSTLDVTALGNPTSEPSDSADIYLSRHVHPITGCDIVFPPGRELIIKAAERLGIRGVSPGQNSTFNVSFEGEE